MRPLSRLAQPEAADTRQPSNARQDACALMAVKRSLGMSSAVLERAPQANFGTSKLGYQAGPASSPEAAGTNWLVLPRCEIRFEKCAGGVKIHCECDDEMACATLQNLCRMCCDQLCSCCCTMNGIPCCQVNLCCGTCKCDLTKNGCCITCTSGDKGCCKMLQAACDCLSCCCENGCCCYISFGSTCVCCGKLAA
jgi:hypothetical protein